jgi:hypothetical protein
MRLLRAASYVHRDVATNAFLSCGHLNRVGSVRVLKDSISMRGLLL